ncbi:pyruvate carboxylase subunit B [Hujiaoplasma nucleasis]|uniref:Pyruvate carboxylase subunit B n=1 Tax=Hujiaoplasma nucleasis TaxID=2725268 RepID=A0A7L6N8W7_9MOLU|nr:pyruvate carboxylase subunit B [Hujiaoplasma nucleasis]
MMSVKFVETALRDGHQSLMATRLTTDEILAVLPELDKAGYYALEVWGGATFDASLRFLNEDPWERLRKMRKVAKKTKLQMLFRGQNILGYKHYPDDIVEKFVEKSLENGIDIIRIFDALNDLRNLETSAKAVKKYNGHLQIALSYTTSPVHSINYYVDLAKKAENMGADSLCIKDMSGILMPDTAFDLIKALKNNIKIPINFHTHATSGLAPVTYAKAIEAGVDIIDTALSPLSGGTSQVATEAIATLLGQDNTLDFNHLEAAKDILTKIKDKYLENGILNPKALTPNPKILHSQIPGGMISNLLSQLKDQKALDKYEEVLNEVPKVRKDLGYPPLVTPLSQMVGTQAIMNILSGQRYKLVPGEIKAYLRGEYGQAPGDIDPNFRKSIIGDDPVLSHRPADNLEPQFENIKEKYKDIVKSDEDVLSIALFESVALKFFKSQENETIEFTLHTGGAL